MPEAESLYRQILDMEPDNPYALHLLGVVHYQRGENPIAAELIRRAIQFKSDIADFHSNLGAILMPMGRIEEAADALQKALALNPGNPDALNNFGNILKDKGQLDEAIASYRRAIELRSNYADAWGNLGNALKLIGHIDEAIQSYRRSLSLRPNPTIASNLCYALHFHPNITAGQIHEEHVAWDQQYAKPLSSQITPHANDRAPDRRLRIGYISPDFRAHPIGRFLLPLFMHYDHQNFEIVCYSDVWQPDAVTEALRGCADVWRQTAGVADAKVADVIRLDKIDLLIDLTMHMQNNRMLVFARKPAPIQATYLAYCSTTGVSTIDYRISDPFLDPPGSDESIYTEKTIRLPTSYWCYHPPPVTAELRDPPCLSGGRITFGSMNNAAKVTAPTLRMWAELLRAVPHSDLLIYAHEGSHRQEVTEVFARHGVEPARLRFVPMVPLGQYFTHYHRIDIALDPFPYGGGTTTCDALWMGVPVVTMTGQTAVSRAGLSILSNTGISEWVAESPERYIAIAAGLAGDIQKLKELRLSLRPLMQASSLMDAPRFAREIEGAYRKMWRESQSVRTSMEVSKDSEDDGA